MTDEENRAMILDALLTLEHRGWDSLRGGTVADFYGDLMTEKAVMMLAPPRPGGEQS